MAMFGDNDSKTGLSLESKTTKYIGWGLLAAGLSMSAFALYKSSKGKKSGKLSGVGRKRLRSGKRRAKRIDF